MLNIISVLSLQFNVLATDGAIPEKNATTLIYVRVKRDLRDPIFESKPYKVIISEILPVGRVIFTLRGRDDDKMVRS